ncbi:MAG: hypothetical protein ACRCS0_14450 [Albidovulum sp.]
MPWAVVSSLATALLVFPLTKRRTGGTDVFKVRFANSAKAWMLTLAAGVLVAASLWEVGAHVYVVMVTQTITVDCDGRAEPITVVMTGPILQFSPLVQIAFTFWMLHVRALALSPDAKHGNGSTTGVAGR